MGKEYRRFEGQTGSVEMVSPDGKTSEYFPSSVQGRQESEGWTVKGGQAVTVDTAHGQSTMSLDSAGSLAATGSRVSVAPLVEQAQAYDAEQGRQEFEGRGAEAAALGAARGLTFGLSDGVLSGSGLVEADTLEGLQEHNTGASLAGEFIPLVASTIASGGTGLAAKAIQKTPAGWVALKTAQAGAKSTKAFIAANAAEAALYGVGNNISQIAIHDEPLTAENVIWNSVKDAGFGGVFGGAGAAAFKGGAKLVAKGKNAFKTADPLFDIATPEGSKFMGQTSKHLRESVDMGDDLMVKTAPGANKVTDAEKTLRAEWTKYEVDVADSLSARVTQRRKSLGPDVELPPKPASVEQPEIRLDADFDADGRFVGGADDAIKATNPEIEELESLISRRAELSKRAEGLSPADTKRFWKEAQRELNASGRNKGQLKTLEKELKAAKLKAAKDTSLAGHMTPAESFGKAARGDAKSGMAYAKYQDDMAAWESKVAALQKADAGNASLKAGWDEALEVLKKGEYGADDLLKIKKMLGDSPENMGKFRTKWRKQAELDDSIIARSEAPVTSDSGWAREEYAKAAKELNASLGGVPTASSLAKVINGKPEDVMRFHAAASRHYEAAVDLAQVSGDKAALKAAEKQIEILGKHIDGAMSAEMREATKHLTLDTMAMAGLGVDLALDGGPLDGLAKAAMVMGLVSGRAGKKGRGLLSKLVSSGGAGSARSMVKGSGAMKAGARSFAGRAGYEATKGSIGKLWSPASIFQASGRANSAVGQAVQRMLSGTVKSTVGGAGAKAALKALKFNDDLDEKTEKSNERLDQLFKRKADSLVRFAANPQSMAQSMYDEMAELRAAHPTLGDKAEVGKGRVAQYLLDKMPRDPGNQHVMGKSTWRPSDLQIQSFANSVTGAMDPIGVFDGITDGSISLASARAVKELYPETFSKLQMEVAKNADAIREKLSYSAQNRLSIFMGVPVNSTNTPEYRKFIVEQYTQAQSASQEASKGVDANALIQGTPTQAQQLLKRGAK